MKELSEINDVYLRRDKAVEFVKEAVDIKHEMNLYSMTAKRRKLREDKKLNNEFYVGRKGHIGEFYFERKPSPDVKMDEVIGESFDEAKKHLSEIVDTSEFSKLMALTAPGGKVRSNILLIGPYGCGKTELGRAVCGDGRVIGASVSAADVLTAYMHESVSNIKRIYDESMGLREAALDSKPVALVLDEFDTWFSGGDRGTMTDTDMHQIKNIFLEVLDGMENYNGIITIAMTNQPLDIPHGIVRRFRYVDIVGQLNNDERKQLLGLYLEKRLPVTQDVKTQYDVWAEKLKDAPGDVVRKVVDEVHFDLIPSYIRENKDIARKILRVVDRREVKYGKSRDEDITYVKDQLQKYGCIVTPEQVNYSLDKILKRPNIQMQISDARKVYREAKQLLDDMGKENTGFGLKHNSSIFEIDR